jgi:hypothetical protein
MNNLGTLSIAYIPTCVVQYLSIIVIIIIIYLYFLLRCFLTVRLCDNFIDPEMQHEIDTYLSKGEAIFSVLLLVGLPLVGKSFKFSDHI